MIRGMYTAAAGALVAQADADNIANNLANVSTTGFKATLLQVQANSPLALNRNQTESSGNSVSSAVGDLGLGSQVYNTPTTFAQGTLTTTGNAYDLAITGNGFFNIQTPQGLRYTRDGSFVRNGQGLLMTKDGNLVLGQNGQAITVPDGDVKITSDGTLNVNNAPIGRVQLTSFQNLQGLGKQGSDLFFDAGANPQTDTASTISQGQLESSNANVIRSMVDLITAQRWFDANEKSIQTEDTATAQALQSVGNSKG